VSWLFQFSSAEDTAVVFSAPDIVVEHDKIAVPGKPVCFAVELYQILIQIQHLADYPVSDALHTHTQYLLFLRFGHMLQVLQIA